MVDQETNQVIKSEYYLQIRKVIQENRPNVTIERQRQIGLRGNDIRNNLKIAMVIIFV